MLRLVKLNCIISNSVSFFGECDMDDFGNELHWTDTVNGWHSLGLYAWAGGLTNMCVLYQSIDFTELDQ